MQKMQIKSPSEKIAERHKRQEQQENARNELDVAFNAVASTPEGQRILQYIAKSTGFGQNPALFRTGMEGVMPLEGATMYNVARQSVYIEHIRPFLSIEYRNIVEK